MLLVPSNSELGNHWVWHETCDPADAGTVGKEPSVTVLKEEYPEECSDGQGTR